MRTVTVPVRPHTRKLPPAAIYNDMSRKLIREIGFKFRVKAVSRPAHANMEGRGA